MTKQNIKAQPKVKVSNDEISKKAAMDEKEIKKIRYEQELKRRQQMAARKKYLKEHLELKRLEVEDLELTVKYYQYSQILQEIEDEERKLRLEEDKAAKELEDNKNEDEDKILKIDKDLVDAEGNPFKKDK